MPRNTGTNPDLNPEWVRIGATVRTIREGQGMKVGELAGAVRPEPISYAYLSNIEAGRKKLTAVMATRIARALGVSRISLVRNDWDDGTDALAS